MTTERVENKFVINSRSPELEKILGSFGIEAKRFERARTQTRAMVNLVAKVDVFADDQSDEFRVIRENGRSQGIFKTWAVPVIPFLEAEKEEELASLLQAPMNKADFWENIGPELTVVAESWTQRLKDNPVGLQQSLEKWRSRAHIFDRRLFQLFQARVLSEEKTERFAELFWRLKVAFGYLAPFYHLEAMIAESQQTRFNPIDICQEDLGSGGVLDMVGMLLPSAMRGKVMAEKLDWHGLNWKKIDGLASGSPDDDRELQVALRMARETGTSVEDVIFAANALEWIPVSVGGKKNDLEPELAQGQILEKMSQKGKPTVASVARDMNGLIRFLNWFPLVRTEVNFLTGEGWRYAAVCDTANLLLNEVKQGGVFEEEFEKVFEAQLADQVDQLDATSAKGRFLLALVEEERLRPEVQLAVNDHFDLFLDEISLGLAVLQQKEAVSFIGERQPRLMVGGKTAGLEEARMIFGQEAVLEGAVISSETIEEWLREDEELWSLVREMDLKNPIEDKIALGMIIEDRIKKSEFPKQIIARLPVKQGEMVAVRSSSFDEDTVINGTAAGIYHSELPVIAEEIEMAVPLVVASFFSEKAICFRALYGLSDKPNFSILIAPFVDGPGGAIFSSGQQGGWEVVIDERPSLAVGNARQGKFDSYKEEKGRLRKTVNSGWFEDSKVQQIGSMVTRAEELFGDRVDMEFVLGPEGPKILQLRFLKEAPTVKMVNQEEEKIINVPISQLSELANLIIDENQRARLLIGYEINLDQFQGDLFRWLVTRRGAVSEIVLSQRVSRTGHLANICLNLGIKLSFNE